MCVCSSLTRNARSFCRISHLNALNPKGQHRPSRTIVFVHVYVDIQIRYIRSCSWLTAPSQSRCGSVRRRYPVSLSCLLCRNAASSQLFDPMMMQKGPKLLGFKRHYRCTAVDCHSYFPWLGCNTAGTAIPSQIQPHFTVKAFNQYLSLLSIVFSALSADRRFYDIGDTTVPIGLI